MSKKLLHKTQRIYLIYSVITLIITAPLFYFITEHFYIDDADKTLILYKSEFMENLAAQLKETDIPVWNRFNNVINIEGAKSLQKDSLFYTFYFDELEQENEPYRELNSPIIIEGEPYTFVARINLVESEDLMASIALLFLVIIILLLLGLFIITKRLSLSIWKPFYDTLNQIEHFEIDKNKQPQFRETEIEEFSRLNRSIKKLIEKNIAIYQNQREFVENAAHELQTPIAIFQGKLDSLIQRQDITQGQSEILESLNHSVSRLNRLNKNLLLLSKIERNQFDETEMFSMKELIEKLLDFFVEQAGQKNIRIMTELDDDFTINANVGLTEILVSNLFLNGIRHNVQNGELTISLSQEKLVMTNTGHSEELSKAKLFSRFSKSDPSSRGTGLGLAIVKKIATLNNWTITYSYSNNLHSFSVQF